MSNDSTLSNYCQPVACICDERLPKEPLNFGISFFTPISSEPGSASFFYLQPLITGKTYAALGVLIAAQVFIFIVSRVVGFRYNLGNGASISPDQTVNMTVNDLQDFLSSVSNNMQSSSELTVSGTLETSEVPLVIALTVWGILRKFRMDLLFSYWFLS